MNQNNNKLIRILIMLITVMGTLLAVFVAQAISPQDGTKATAISNRERISVLETELKAMREDIQEIKSDIKELLRK